MNERATEPRPLLPLWHVGREASFFAGSLGVHARHAHSVPVLIAGLYDAFTLTVEGVRPTLAKAAIIPAGRPYALDGGATPIAVLYLEPGNAGVETLRPLLRETCETNGVVLGKTGEGPLRDLFEDRNAARWVEQALADLIAFAERRSARESEPRIARVLQRFDTSEGADAFTLEASAREAGLSASRFQHLFTREVGVPFRRYRIWQRVKAAISEIAQGEAFARAAHAAGFSDQAHFSREFHRMFGAPPSRTLRNVRA